MRDCPSNDFYMVEPNGLPVKKRDMSQERQKPKDGPVAEQPVFKLIQGRVEGPGRDPHPHPPPTPPAGAFIARVGL